MKGGTLQGLCKEDKAKIGYLYQQLLRERDEKEDILENYNMEKERFEQVIDLLHNQREQEQKIKTKHIAIDQELKLRESRKSSIDYQPIPFNINSNSKQVLAQTPVQTFDIFQSPRTHGKSQKSDMASPAECFGKVFKDIKDIKGQLSAMHKNMKSLVFSPERSADRNLNTSRSNLQKSTPKLTLKDLTTDHRRRNRRPHDMISESSSDDTEYITKPKC